MSDKNGNGRKYVSKGVSAPKEWWSKVEGTANDLSMNKSLLIRVAVDTYLKEESAETKLTLSTVTP